MLAWKAIYLVCIKQTSMTSIRGRYMHSGGLSAFL